MRPTDIVRLRRRLVDDTAAEIARVAGPNFEIQKAAELLRDSKSMPNDTREYLSHVLRSHALLTIVSLYFVTDDMTTLASAAGHTMPDQGLRWDDIPEEHGFIVFSKPVARFAHEREGEIDVIGFMWIRKTAHVDLIAITDSLSDGIYWADYALRWTFGDPPIRDREGWDFTGTLLATWTLMRQRISAPERMTAPRGERRISERAGLTSDVTVIHLRRPIARESIEETENRTVEWSHRWVVEGHWRKQWLRSRGCHRLQWISAYIKGPDEKPLVLKERLHVWSR